MVTRDVLDYSGGYPPPTLVAAQYGGIVRYIGTPGRGKNLTRGEAQAMLAAGVPVGLVYETSAGWATGGFEVGVGAARAALADAAACGVGVRCVYFAVDFDVTDAQQMQSVERTLDGAASVLGRARAGAYGEADVIDACLAGGHATWGWQTRAWSGGRVSTRAHLLQQLGYVYPGGVQCDRNTVLQDDWGQWPLEDDMSDAQFDALTKQISDVYRLLSVGDARDDAAGGDPGGHPWNLERLRADLTAMQKALTGQLTAQAQAITTLSGLVAANAPDLTEDQVEAAVARAISEGLVHVHVDIAGQQQSAGGAA